MNPQVLKAGAVVSALALTGVAHAGSVDVTPVVVPADNSIVTIEFVSASADYTGEFSFLGSGTALQITLPAIDTGEPGLGQQVFTNQGGPTESLQLQGTHNAGDVLHFAYRIIAPLDVTDLLRTDVPVDQAQFQWDAETGLLAIEDLRATSDIFDGDFNDLIVRVTFSAVPTPGTAFLAVLGLFVAFRGRRRFV